MASIGDLKGRVVIQNAGSAVLRAIKGDIEAIANASRRVSLGQFSQNALASTRAHVDRLNRTIRGSAATAAGAGFAVRGIVDATKDFQESKFGFGFATLTDYLRDGRLELDAWKKNMDVVALRARQSAKDFGTNADVTMRAREETQKLGFKGAESDAIFGSAVSLHLAEPRALASGEAAKFMGTVYRAYAKQRDELAKKLGADANDPKFVSAYVKSLGAKAAVAGADSALGPSDIVEGMRQFAPQWAAMGIDYEFALAMLAHGSNYGFRAPELGTAFKSMVTKIVNPTAGGLRVMNDLGIDRSKYMRAGPTDPLKGATRLNNMLSGGLFSGRGGKQNKSTIIDMMETARRQGVTSSPEFQQALTQEVLRMLKGKGGYEGRIDDVTQAVSNATMTPNSIADLPALLKDLRDKGATVGQIAEMFEGRHVARYTPVFQFYEDLIKQHEKLKSVDGSVQDAVVEARKSSEAGKTDQVAGSFKELLLSFEQAGGLIDKLKDAVIGLNHALASAPKELHTGLVGAGIGVGGLALVGGLLGLSGMVGRGARAGGGMFGKVALGGAAMMVPGVGQGMAAWHLLSSIRQARIVGALAGGGSGAFMKALMLGGAATRFGMMFNPLMLALSAGALGWGGYSAVGKYRETGDVWQALKAFIGLGDASAAEGGGPVSGIPNPEDAMRSGPAGGMGQALAEMRAQLSAVDLTADGQRIMSTLESGIRSGTAGVIAAMDEAVAGIRDRAASAAGSGRVQLNTGPTMSGAH